ncbi:DUF6527 family protein [Kribbella sp. NPDC002412]
MPWRYIIVGVVDAADEIPLELAARTAVLVQSANRPTWIAFDCPRHRDQRIMLNLSTRRRPYWTIHDRATLTLRPSIDATHNGSRCHFWLRRGHLRWAKLIRLNKEGRGYERQR